MSGDAMGVNAVKARRRKGGLPKAEKPTGGLKLLIRFEDPLPVKERLDFQGRAQKSVEANVDAALRDALAKAMARS